MCKIKCEASFLTDYGLPLALSPTKLAQTLLGAAKSTISQRHQGPDSFDRLQTIASRSVISPLRSSSVSSKFSERSATKEDQASCSSNRGYYTGPPATMS